MDRCLVHLFNLGLMFAPVKNKTKRITYRNSIFIATYPSSIQRQYWGVNNLESLQQK